MKPSAIQLNNLVKTFTTRRSDPVHAVRGIDLTITSGEVVAFLGANGAGKTTTLDMVLGLTTPTSGVVEVFGTTPRAAVNAGQVSAVLQSGGLLNDLTVRETVQIIAATHPQHSGVDTVIERAGLTKLANRRVSKCSGGEQQRLRFALALLPDPDLLILDEPTAGMDAGARNEFWDTMHQEAEAGKTIVFATHYLAEAEQFSDRTVIMAQGQIITDGPTHQVRASIGGNVVTAAVPQPTVATLSALPMVSAVEYTAGTATIHTSDSDHVARLLLTELGGQNLSIAAGNLEDAFLHLTNTTNTEQETTR